MSLGSTPHGYSSATAPAGISVSPPRSWSCGSTLTLLKALQNPARPVAAGQGAALVCKERQGSGNLHGDIYSVASSWEGGRLISEYQRAEIGQL